MDDTERTAALVSACGGAGGTRLAVETAATLARDGRSVAVVDVAFETQGLADYVPGDLPTDVTAVLADDAPAGEARAELPVDAPGTVAAYPARGPFERFARAQTAEAARSLEELLADAAGRFDHVLVDTPPVATNGAVAAVTAADAVGVFAPPTDRGANAVSRVRGRLADVGAGADLVVANRAGSDPDGRADVVVPESEVTAAVDAPAATDPDEAFAPAVADLAGALFDADLDLSFPEGGLLDGLA